MNKIFPLSLFIGLIMFCCSDPNTIGLEVQPISDNIIISDLNSFNWQTSQTVSEDYLRTDESGNLILGEIASDEIFLNNLGGFYTQILLTQNNIDIGSNPIVDSVVLSYTYNNYYGDLQEFEEVEVVELSESLHKDSIYYSNLEIVNPSSSINLVESFSLNNDDQNPVFSIRLQNLIGQKIVDLGNDALVDNETFLQNFYGFSISARASNTMLYLTPEGSNTHFKIYYHNDESGSDTLSLDFELGGDVARVNLFNEKNENSITEDNSRIYIQSMAGYKVKISINNVDSLEKLLNEKVLNKVSLIFSVQDFSQLQYEAHEKLVLVRVNNEGDNIFLSDFTIEGDEYFGGNLENNKYIFNITRYFKQLLDNDSYTNDLYLLPAGAAVNANRTILNKDVELQIFYSDI